MLNDGVFPLLLILNKFHYENYKICNGNIAHSPLYIN